VVKEEVDAEVSRGLYPLAKNNNDNRKKTTKKDLNELLERCLIPTISIKARAELQYHCSGPHNTCHSRRYPTPLVAVPSGSVTDAAITHRCHARPVAVTLT
jgi:hypothetical protein